MVKWMCHKEEWSRRTGPDGAYIFLPKPDDDDDDDELRPWLSPPPLEHFSLRD